MQPEAYPRNRQNEAFDLSAFDDDFFAGYEAELQDVSVEEQAAAALADILTVTNQDGIVKTYEDIRDESRKFFANEWVQQSEMLMNQVASQFAAACMSHPHGSELAQDSILGSVFNAGIEASHGPDDGHGHDNHEHDDDDIDPITGESKKKKKKKEQKQDKGGWLSYFMRKATKS